MGWGAGSKIIGDDQRKRTDQGSGGDWRRQFRTYPTLSLTAIH